MFAGSPVYGCLEDFPDNSQTASGTLFLAVSTPVMISLTLPFLYSNITQLYLASITSGILRYIFV